MIVWLLPTKWSSIWSKSRPHLSIRTILISSAAQTLFLICFKNQISSRKSKVPNSVTLTRRSQGLAKLILTLPETSACWSLCGKTRLPAALRSFKPMVKRKVTARRKLLRKLPAGRVSWGTCQTYLGGGKMLLKNQIKLLQIAQKLHSLLTQQVSTPASKLSRKQTTLWPSKPWKKLLKSSRGVKCSVRKVLTTSDHLEWGSRSTRMATCQKYSLTMCRKHYVLILSKKVHGWLWRPASSKT